MSSQAWEMAVCGRHPEWTVTRVQTTSEPDDNHEALNRLDDGRLVEASQAGSHAAFAVLVERHRRAVYQLCYRFAGNHEDAADLAQEVFLRAYRGLARFRGDASVSTWLYRIGVNASLNRVTPRRASHVALDEAPELQAGSPDPAAALLASEQAAHVRAAIAQLPDKQRATVVLRVYQGLSHREIAGVLGTTEGAAKANLFHALGNLRKLLGEGL